MKTTLFKRVLMGIISLVVTSMFVMSCGHEIEEVISKKRLSIEGLKVNGTPLKVKKSGEVYAEDQYGQEIPVEVELKEGALLEVWVDNATSLIREEPTPFNVALEFTKKDNTGAFGIIIEDAEMSFIPEREMEFGSLKVDVTYSTRFNTYVVLKDGTKIVQTFFAKRDEVGQSFISSVEYGIAINLNAILNEAEDSHDADTPSWCKDEHRDYCLGNPNGDLLSKIDEGTYSFRMITNGISFGKGEEIVWPFKLDSLSFETRRGEFGVTGTSMFITELELTR